RLSAEETPPGPAYAARFGAVPVMRLQGEAPSIEHRGVTLLGLPAGDLTRIRWRGDFASEPPRALQEQIGGPPVSLRGTPIPADARELSLPVTIHGDPITLSANVRTRDGRFVVLDLGEPPNNGRSVARARSPPDGRSGALCA